MCGYPEYNKEDYADWKQQIRCNGFLLRHVPIHHRNNELSLIAVTQNGYALQYVPHQTEEICLAAVKEYPWSLIFVEHQTEEICIEALKGSTDVRNLIHEDILTPRFKVYVAIKYGFFL